MEQLSWWDTIVVMMLGIQPVQETHNMPSWPQHMMQSKRDEFRVGAQKQLEAFSWQTQNPAWLEALKVRQTALPKPKRQVLSMRLHASDKVDEHLTNHLTLNMTVKPHTQSELWLVNTHVNMVFFKHAFDNQAQTLWQPWLGVIRGWNDSKVESELWRTTQLSAWQQPLQDGSLPRHLTFEHHTSNQSLTNWLPKKNLIRSDCKVSEPYLGTRVHANIQGKVQLVTCERVFNGKPLFPMQSLYLMDYQFHLPTADHLFDRRWQWRISEFQDALMD